MKKKIFLMVVIVLVAVLTCTSLVACDGGKGDNNGSENEEIIEGGNNGSELEEEIVPDSIKAFINLWCESESKYLVRELQFDGETEITEGKAFGNFYQLKVDDVTNYYSQIDGKKVISWDYDEENNVWSAEENIYNEESSIVILERAYWTSLEIFTKIDSFFEKNGNVYNGIEGGEFEGLIIEITAKQMTIRELDTIWKYHIGGVEPFEIPEELRNIYESSVAKL